MCLALRSQARESSGQTKTKFRLRILFQPQDGRDGRVKGSGGRVDGLRGLRRRGCSRRRRAPVRERAQRRAGGWWRVAARRTWWLGVAGCDGGREGAVRNFADQ